MDRLFIFTFLVWFAGLGFDLVCLIVQQKTDMPHGNLWDLEYVFLPLRMFVNMHQSSVYHYLRVRKNSYFSSFSLEILNSESCDCESARV